MLILKCVGGRYTGIIPPVHRKHLVTATLTVRHGVVEIAIHDGAHPDRWENFEGPVENLAEMIKEEIINGQDRGKG